MQTLVFVQRPRQDKPVNAWSTLSQTAAAPRCVLPVLPTGMEHSEKMMKIENCIGQTDCLVITVGTRVRM